MASATHQRSSSASINPATLIEACRVYSHNGLLGRGSSSNLSTSHKSSTESNHHQSTIRAMSVPSTTEWDAELPVCFCEKRHVQPIDGIKCITQSWRMKERVSRYKRPRLSLLVSHLPSPPFQMKTVSVALVMCLNVGVDPPDVMKIQPCARMECWIDPSSVSQQKALELIGTNLQKQYERWQPRARYKQSLDPTVEDVKKLCTSLRRNAKDERVLFHYNGHGVPRPTNNGEIWVFNRVGIFYLITSLDLSNSPLIPPSSATRNTSHCPSTTCRPGWALPRSTCTTAAMRESL